VPTVSARFPNRILTNSIKQSENTDLQYIVCRAIVLDVDTVGGKFNDGKSPQNSIKAKIIKPSVDTSDYSETVLWPLNDYIVNPIFPTEQVLCIFETSTLDFGYWINRFPNIDKSYLTATSSVDTAPQNSSTTAAFGVPTQEQDLTIDDLTRSRGNLQQEVTKYSKFKKQFKFDKRFQDTIVASKNTARIVLGSDRVDSKDSGADESEAIDIVVGVQKENGDPDFINDKSRSYISSKSDNIIEDLGNQEDEALWYEISDNNAIIARKDILIQSKDGETKIKFNRNGSIDIEGNQKVTIHANNVVVDGTTVIGGASGTNKILTTMGPDIPSLLEQVAIFLDAVTFADFAPSGAPPVSKAALSNASAKLHEVAAAIQVATKSNAV
jgi:hypothetical protein